MPKEPIFEKGVDVLKHFIAFIIAFPIAIGMAYFYAWAYRHCWEWFILGTFTSINPSIWQLVGISMTLGFLRNKSIYQPATEKKLSSAFIYFASPLAIVVTGFVIKHWFM